MRLHQGMRVALSLMGLLAALVTGSTSGRANNFYQGKQLVVLVNFAPGGPTDAEARLLARNLARLIPGSPSVIVQNMAGSNGAVAANWLANAAAPDGLILGYFTGIAAMRALGDPILSENVAKLAFAAAGPGIAVTYGRTDIGGGIKKPADLLSKKDVWLGGLRIDSDRDIRLRMQLDLLGVKHNYLSGFPAISDARQAFQRGDIQILLEPITAYRASIEPSLVANGTAMPLWLDPLDDGETFIRSPEADNLPALTFSDVLLQKHGELPKSELFEAWRLVNQIGTLFQRVVVMAPGAPDAAVQAVQKAVARFAEDAGFREDALMSIKLVPSFLADSKTAALFRRVTDPEPRLQAFLHKYVDKVRPDAAAPSVAKEPKEKAAAPSEALRRTP
jgi:hypothetical protein